MHTPLLATSLLAALVLATGPTFAIPLGTNITIPDQNTSGTGWYGNHEDNETESHPDTLRAQDWDLEGMFLGGSRLTLVGGFDFKNGVTYNHYNYRSGDIFIDVNGDAQYGYPVNGGSGLGGTTSNLFGYDYVLDLDFASMTYNVIKLDSSALLARGLDVAGSNPWRYVSGGDALAGFQGVSFDYYSGLTNADVGFQGYNGDNGHYAISVDTSFLGSGDFVFHNTVECGNDNLMGAAHVPDGGSTVTLLGLSLVGVVALRRRRR